MRLQRQIEQLVSQQASEWIEVLKMGGEKERAAFVAWLKESRRHVSEFLSMVAVDRELNGLDVERRHDLEELLAKVAPHAAIPLTPAPLTRGRRRGGKRRWIAAIAATVCALAVAIAWMQRSPSYSTGTGELRSFELADGSTVHLNAQTKMKVNFSNEARDIDLLDGEALFKVARNLRRPFRVHVGSTVIQAIGTQFNVYRRAADTAVSVIEGKVLIEDELLAAGEEAHIVNQGKVEKLPHADVRKATAWRERRLVFRDDTLEAMALEFNRYNVEPQFQLEGEAVKRRHYSGTFDADDPQSLAALLSRERDIVIEEEDGKIVISPKMPPP